MRSKSVYGGGLVWRMTRRGKMTKVKLAIQTRLMTEDYTCRLPKPPKPKVRYLLRLREHYTLSNQGLTAHCEFVWK